ncbi:gamma-butyrobetaine dioxygenase-like [Patiria miniata]|uniref:Gamma-butyrobetaine dioxygenase n=1 Tax=Patiria miniata TaxID=46514 RepID=A0A914BK69_PATMI|nr:gamma-butyrobetaine dioxygenase-like [Patiria miniata]
MEPSSQLTSIKRDDSARWYRVCTDNGFEGTYPYVWLRDNCRCSQCFNPSFNQRTLKIVDLDPDVIPSSETIVDDGQVLRVIWPDQHRSDFQAAWLSRRHFSDRPRDLVTDPELQSWGAELNGNIPTFDFQKLLEDDVELYNWLDVLNTKGLAFVKGAPTEKGAGGQIAERIAYLRRTLFGETFQVSTAINPSRPAHTLQAIGLHVDQPYLNYLPGIQMLHCIEKINVEGAENQFADGLRVAEQIREEYSEEYHLLTTREVDYETTGVQFGKSFHLKSRLPTIQLDMDGKFQCIRYADIWRATSMSKVPVGQVTKMYKALKLLNDVMYRPENLVRHQLAEGEIVTFSNHRVLHSRSAITITGEGSRHLEGSYIDWDEALSRMRVLHRKLFCSDARP